MFGVNRARCATLLAVIELAPMVRPWNAPRNAMSRLRVGFVQRAAFSAASFASVPLEHRNTFLPVTLGTSLASISATSACNGE
jgi:hypothetical protein